MSNPNVLLLELIKESKIYKLLASCNRDSRLEASGVLSRDGYCYVIFDNLPDIAQINNNLDVSTSNHLILQQDYQGQDYEDISFDYDLQRFLVVQETHFNDESGTYSPRIDEYDCQFKFIETHPVDFIFKGHVKKGIEGLAYVNWGGKPYAIGLSEGNKAKEGKKSLKTGHGRIHIFEKETKQWGHRATLKLPKTANFIDYAGICIEGSRVAVVSQESSALWVGQLEENGWYFVDEGEMYWFPRNAEGEIIYGNIEGVAWLDENTLVMVSDKRKVKLQAKICEAKDQSIHIFKLPLKNKD